MDLIKIIRVNYFSRRPFKILGHVKATLPPVPVPDNQISKNNFIFFSTKVLFKTIHTSIIFIIHKVNSLNYI